MELFHMSAAFSRAAAAICVLLCACKVSAEENCEDEDEALKLLSGNPMASCGLLKGMGRCDSAYALCPKTCEVCGKQWDHLHWHEINLTNSFPEVLLRDLESEPQILSCFYGYAGCIGVPDDENTEDALRRRGCAVVGSSPRASTATQFGQFCSQRHFSVSRAPLPSPLDGMPCTLSFPIDMWSLETVEQIQVELSDGRVVTPDCATLLPAIELAQLHTLLLLSDSFGAKPDDGQKATYPVAVRIQGIKPLYATIEVDSSKRGPFDLVYSGDMRYNDTGVQLIRARLLPVALAETLDSTGVGLLSQRNGPSTCQAGFPEATHSLQVMFNGGMTKDGVTNVASSEAASVYDIRLNGQQLTTEILGLEDNENADNYHEICLRLSDDQLLAASEGSFTVETPCSGSSALYGPKGLCSEAASACTATACRQTKLDVEMSLITIVSTSAGATLGVSATSTFAGASTTAGASGASSTSAPVTSLRLLPLAFMWVRLVRWSLAV
eukprot:TRINITY_DN33798_c0_g1_i1.p1 TRINITY_DN33798_c0_g1~~TRINITY_DN33798_c0_g1_i1.p1  ORF type:complete len:497 (-),score=49.57 TRINITY_DN33798_c0_g1_i1:31-1521(-)